MNKIFFLVMILILIFPLAALADLSPYDCTPGLGFQTNRSYCLGAGYTEIGSGGSTTNAPNSPTGLSYQIMSDGSVLLNWNPVNGANGYIITVDGVRMTKAGIQGTSYTFPSAPGNHTVIVTSHVGNYVSSPTQINFVYPNGSGSVGGSVPSPAASSSSTPINLGTLVSASPTATPFVFTGSLPVYWFGM